MTIPFTKYYQVWDAKAASETVVLDGQLVRLCPTKVFEIITTGFSGTLDIKGRISPAATLDNVNYFRMNQGQGQKASNAQLSYTTDTGRYRYMVTEPHMDMSLVMTRSAGSITIYAAGWGLLAPMNLGLEKLEDAAHASGDAGLMLLGVRKDTAAALAGTDGDYMPPIFDASGRLHVAPLAAGTAILGKVGIDQTTPGTTNKVVADPATATPTSYNLTLTDANTEYSQALPANCRFFEVQARTEATVRYAFVTGKVAGSTAPYHTLKAGDYYSSPAINQGVSPSTLYAASPTAGTVLEILAWT